MVATAVPAVECKRDACTYFGTIGAGVYGTGMWVRPILVVAQPPRMRIIANRGYCHAALDAASRLFWIPAFAGMTAMLYAKLV